MVWSIVPTKALQHSQEASIKAHFGVFNNLHASDIKYTILNAETSEETVKQALAGEFRIGIVHLFRRLRASAVLATPEQTITHIRAIEKLDAVGRLIALVVDEAHLVSDSGW